MNADKYILELETRLTKVEQENLNLRNENRRLHTYFKAFQSSNSWQIIARMSDGIFIDLNDACANALGFTREELIGKDSFAVWEDSEETRRNIISDIKNDISIKNFPCKFRRKSREIGVALASIEKMEINGENFFITSAIDITEHKLAVDQLHQFHQRFYKAFNNSPIAIAILSNIDDRHIDVNQHWEKLFGYSREEIIGKTAQDQKLWVDQNNIYKFYQKVKARDVVEGMEQQLRKKSGEMRHVILSSTTIYLNEESCRLVAIRDLTEEKKYKSEIARLDNLKLIGQMAAGVAHEIRNPMTSIRGFMQLFQTQDRYKEDKEAMDLIIEELDRVNDIVTAFLSLAKKSIINLKSQNLNDILFTLMPLIMADALKNGITVRTELQNLSPIMIDESEIKQVILNLVRNGIQAMSDGEFLTIGTYEDNHGVNLIVQDQGQGIPNELLDKIGMPFFTTKEHGTGLGLAVCYSIAERHNAKIIVETSSKGTSFKVTFPVPIGEIKRSCIIQ